MDKREQAQRQVSELAKAVEEKVRYFFGIQISYPITVALNTREVIANGLLPWAVSGLRSTIIVRYPQIASEQIAHEMSHFSLRFLRGNRPVPLWFDEGLACHFGDMGLCGDEAELTRAKEKSTLPDPTAWVGTMGKFAWLYRMYMRRETRLLYGISLLLVERLMQKYGSTTLQGFIHSLKDKDFDESFRQTYGITVNEFYRTETANIG